MKRIYTIVLLTVLAFSATAQDTIFFRNGDELRVKVTEVSDYQIKYKLWSNQNGPVYTKNVSDIFMVKYEGGHKDVFNQSQPAQQQSLVVNNYSYGSVMDVSRGELVVNGRELNSTDVKGIFGQSGYETWASARKQRSIGRTWTIIGAAGSIAGATLLTLDIIDFMLYGGGFIGGGILLGLSQAGLTIGCVLNGAGNGRLNWLASQYNKNGAMSQNLSVSFGPSLVSAPSATGNTYGLGAGIQLSF